MQESKLVMAGDSPLKKGKSKEASERDAGSRRGEASNPWLPENEGVLEEEINWT